MRAARRLLMVGELDTKQKLYRRASKLNRNHGPWLREVRQALGITAVEMARRLKVGRETIFRFERREREMSTSLELLDLMAHAMGCKLAYSVVPQKGTLAELAEAEAWKRRLKGEKGALAEPRKRRQAATPGTKVPKAAAARQETPDEHLDMVQKLMEMAERGGKAAAPEQTDEEEWTEEEKSYRRMLANHEAKGPAASENLRQQILKKIEELRRERVGGPPLETEGEKNARLQSELEVLRRFMGR